MRVITSASAMYIELNKKMQHNEIQENGFIQRFIAAQILIFFFTENCYEFEGDLDAWIEFWRRWRNFERKKTEKGEKIKGVCGYFLKVYGPFCNIMFLLWANFYLEAFHYVSFVTGNIIVLRMKKLKSCLIIKLI